MPGGKYDILFDDKFNRTKLLNCTMDDGIDVKLLVDILKTFNFSNRPIFSGMLLILFEGAIK